MTREDRIAIIARDMAAGSWSAQRKIELAREWGVSINSFGQWSGEASRRVRGADPELGAMALGTLQEVTRRALASGESRDLATAAQCASTMLGYASAHQPPSVQAAVAALRYLADEDPPALRAALRDCAELVREALDGAPIAGLLEP